MIVCAASGRFTFYLENKTMFTQLFAISSLGLLLGAVGVADETAKDCCSKNLACCQPKGACCVADSKLGCCEKAMQCCAQDKGCCAAVQKCCIEGSECCEKAKACCGQKTAAAPKALYKAGQTCDVGDKTDVQKSAASTSDFCDAAMAFGTTGC